MFQFTQANPTLLDDSIARLSTAAQEPAKKVTRPPETILTISFPVSRPHDVQRGGSGKGLPWCKCLVRASFHFKDLQLKAEIFASLTSLTDAANDFWDAIKVAYSA